MSEDLQSRFSIPDDLWTKYLSCFHRLEARAKTVLLQEGDISKKIFFVEKGCVRVWFNQDGKDITFQFFFEHGIVASMESFRKNEPSPVTIETIEPSILWYLHKKDADRLLADIMELPALRDRFIDALFGRTFDYMKHFFSFIKDTPLQRYKSLMRERPEIVQRVPQHYIASYLGISTVHLSRIKGRLAKEKGTR